MLFLLFVQYLSMIFIPLSGGIALLTPIISMVVVYIVMWKNFNAIEPRVRSHLIGLCKLSIKTIVIVSALAIAYEICQGMKEINEGEKDNFTLAVLVLACSFTIKYYLCLVINLSLFRKAQPFTTNVPVPFTKSRLNTIKAHFKVKNAEDSNIQYEKATKPSEA